MKMTPWHILVLCIVELATSSCGRPSPQSATGSFPEHDSSPSVFQEFASQRLSQQGVRVSHQTPTEIELALSDAMAAGLQSHVHQSRQAVNNDFGDPQFVVKGDFMQCLKNDRLDELPSRYTPPPVRIMQTLVPAGSTSAELRSVLYSEIEHARVMDTIYPSQVLPQDASESEVYVMGDFLGTGWVNSAAVVIMYDQEEQMIGFYQMWFVYQAIDLTPPEPSDEP